MFSDVTIHAALESGDLKINPWDELCLQPASVDLTLDNEILIPVTTNDGPIDPLYGGARDFRGHRVQDEFLLDPQRFVLASTKEWVEMGENLCGFVCGKSSLARHGLIVEAAGLVDPGFHGTLTLEMFNMAPRPIRLRPGMRIAQLYVHELIDSALLLYGQEGLGSRYQGQDGPVAAREEK